MLIFQEVLLNDSYDSLNPLTLNEKQVNGNWWKEASNNTPRTYCRRHNNEHINNKECSRFRLRHVHM